MPNRDLVVHIYFWPNNNTFDNLEIFTGAQINIEQYFKVTQ